MYDDDSHVPSYILKDSKTYRYVVDRLGSPDAQTGIIVQCIKYDASSNVIFDGNPNLKPFYFTGGITTNKRS